mgnify:CR=1 FL=1
MSSITDRLVGLLGAVAVLPVYGYEVDGLTPQAVVRPGDRLQVSEVLRWASAERLSVLPRGGGTSLAGQAVNRAVSKNVDAIGLPAGVELNTGGVFSDIQEAFAQMGLAMLLGIVLVYVVMVVSQRSLLTPLVIVLSLPLASILR